MPIPPFSSSKINPIFSGNPASIANRTTGGSLNVDANGTGTINLADASTGLVTVGNNFSSPDITLNGSSQYGTVTDNTTFNGTSITVEMWVRPSSVTSTQDLFDKLDGSNHGIELYLSGTQLRCWFNGVLALQGGTLAINTWYSIAVCVTGGTGYLFVNGVLVNSGTANYTHALTTATLGVFTDTAQQFFNGQIDEVRVSNVARYTTTYTPALTLSSDANTIALWHFNEGSGTSASDSSGNANTMSLVGTPSWGTRTISGSYLSVDPMTGNTIITGTLTFPNTGGTNQFLKQTSLGASVTVSAIALADLPSPTRVRDITFVIDGGGSTITTGVKGYLIIDFASTITQATLLADQSGSVVVNVWKCTYAQFDAGSTHPVSGDSITASAPPTISTATKSQDSTLTGWTTAISAGDVLAFNVNSVTTCQRVTITLRVTV